jgi:hypothetical protein
MAVMLSSAPTHGKEPSVPVIRISRGAFAPADHDKVKEKLAQTEKLLAPELAKLRNLQRYHVAIDRESSTMVNVSLWDSLEDAKQMDQLPAMQALAKEFVAMGVTFERPIINLDILWTLDPAPRR